ncbi:MAG: hypothetical protein ABL907_20290 [Hyphomicrobium sp.]
MSDEVETYAALKSILSALPPAQQALANELRRSALEYAMARGLWRLSGMDDRAAMEKGRSVAHDCFIDAMNALSRACGRAGLSQEWRAIWGDGRTGEARKRLGDLACFIAWQLMLEAR